MKIKPGTSAVVKYKLQDAHTHKDLDLSAEINPVTLSFGTNQLIPEFEKNLMGLSAGDSFDFIIRADDAYGPVDSYAIFDVPSDTFEVDGKIDQKMIRIGNIIPLTDNEGQKHLGKIIKVLENTVTMDFNHPLAGKDLRFTGKVIDVK